MQPVAREGSTQQVLPRRAVFTIVSANYIAFAATLMQSVRTHVAGVERFIILADTPRDFSGLELSAQLLLCDQLGIECLSSMKTWYTILEFNTALKPFAFLHLLETLGFQQCCYLDPDILVYGDLTEAFGALRHHSCVLTPHITTPLQDGKEPSDLTIMKSGIYNLGFLALRRDSEALGLARWWAERCFRHCRVDIAGNMFTDQRWMDLAPTLVSKPYILRHPGYNVAYWNLAHRAVMKTSGGRWRVNGKRLVFFHFSGLAPDNPKVFSKHQNRFSPTNLGPVNELCDTYRHQVLSNHWRKFSREPYGFGYFTNGRRIDEVMRHWIVRSVDEGALDVTVEPRFAPDHFDQRDDIALAKGATLTRYMYQLWLDRRDLRAAFDIFTPTGLSGYFEWFLGGEAEAYGVDAQSLAAARTLRVGGKPQVSATLQRRVPPWQPVATQALTGAAADAIASLACDVVVDVDGVTVSVPRLAALLWERRVDLQSAFDLRVPGRLLEYVCWSISSGLQDGAMDAQCLSADFASAFTRISAISSLYGDVPVTEGMILVRGVGASREFLAGWQRFPVERVGRLAHGLWFCLIAPKLYHWPLALFASVLAWFRSPTSISVDGFNLNRAALALWELRQDLQRTFPLGDRLSVWRYLRWLLVDGLRELGLTIDEFDPSLRAFLQSESPRLAGISQLLEMLHDYRPDLRQRFNIVTPGGRAELLAWSQSNLFSSTRELSLGEALMQRPVASAADALADVVHAKIVLSGYWSAASGRGEDIRGSAKALDAMQFKDYVVVDLGAQVRLDCEGKALKAATRIDCDVNIVHTNADTAVDDAFQLMRLKVHARRTIGFWAWELEWLPDYWRHAYSFYDEIWAATHFAQQAFRRDEARPVKLMPMAVIEPTLGPGPSRSDLGLPDSATVFLCMFDFRSYRSRKNPEAVIRAFLSAFPAGNESVYLLIKTTGAAQKPADAAMLRGLAIDGRIEFRDAELDRAQVLALIRCASAFVSLHRSEGFGRGPAEAMLLSVPVVVTDYSGTCDYATPNNALLVGYQLTRVEESEYPGVTGQQWAQPNIATAARHLRWIHENPDEARKLGRRGREQIRRLYGARGVGRSLLRELGIATEVTGNVVHL